MYVPRVSKDWLRGFLKNKVEKNGNGTNIKTYHSTQNIDEDRNRTEIAWYVVGDGALNNNLHNPLQTFQRYDIAPLEFTSQWVYQDYTSEQLYDDQDENGMIETDVFFHYDNEDHAQLSRLSL